MAGETTSRKFRDCYLLLAKQYGSMIAVEEQFAAANERLGLATQAPLVI
jgi:hypothetical protein